MPPRVTEEYKEQQRERIRAAAFACLQRKGLRSVSMTDVIAESGLSAGAIYRYYASKEELVVDAARAVLASRVHVLAELREQTPLPPPSVAFPRLVTSLPDALSGGGLVQLWGEAVANPAIGALVADAIAAIEGAATEYWTAWWTSRGLPPAAARAAVAAHVPAVVSLAQGYMFARSLRGDEGGRRHLASMREVLRLLENSAPPTVPADAVAPSCTQPEGIDHD